MEPRPTCHRIGRLLACVTSLALLVTLGATSASAARSATCAVTNTDTGKTYPRLQQAVDAAKPRARLVVKGTCVGGSFIDKDLAIRGVKARRTGRPVLDGGLASYSMEGSTRVLTIKPRVKVSIRDLVIRNGRATRIPEGGGISNKGRLTLRDVVVRNNTAVRGGGIYNGGALRMLGRSAVKNNGDLYVAGASPASAVYNVGRLVLDDRTRIRNNLGWTPVVNEGTLRMKGASDISRNFPMRGPSGGVQNRGTLVMDDASIITEQGGVTNSGSLTMNDKSSIHHNIQSGCVSVMCGTGAPGAGVRNSGTLTMNDTSSIHHNWVGGPAQWQAPLTRAPVAEASTTAAP